MTKRGFVTICGCLILLTVTVFARTLQHEFLNFDDFLYVTLNPHVRSGLSVDNVTWAFTTGYDGNWIPLTWISLMLDAELYGDHAGGFHCTNVVLHLANALLVFVILNRTTGEHWKSACVAALFAVHPLHVESVAWISERKDTLSTFFGLLSIGAYTRYCERQAVVPMLFAVVMFLCSLMSKQTLVTLPLLLLLLDFWPLRRINHTSLGGHFLAHTAPDSSTTIYPSRTLGWLLIEKIPFMVLAALFCLIVFFVQRHSGAMHLSSDLSFLDRFANAAIVYVLYLLKTVWPTRLSAFYPYPEGSIPVIQMTGAAVLLTVMTVLAFRTAMRRPYLMMGWLWYLVSLLPMIGLVQIGLQRMADRYTYIPLIGMFVAITWMVAAMVPHGQYRSHLLRAVTITAILACAILSWNQVQVWRSSITLFTHALSVTNDNYFTHRLMGNALLDQGRKADAVKHYHLAVQIRPDYAEAHNALGHVLVDQCDVSKGLYHLREAQYHFAQRSRKQWRSDIVSGQLHQADVSRMDLALTQYFQGNVLEDKGEVEQALEHYGRALRISPDSVMVAHVIRQANNELIQSQVSINHCEQQVAVHPSDAVTHVKLGVAFWSRERFEDSIRQLSIALDIDPRNDDARHNLAFGRIARGLRLMEQQQADAAIAECREAIALLPNSGYIHILVAERLLIDKRFTLAEQHYMEALALGEAGADLHLGLGIALLNQEKREMAKKHLKEAIRLNPKLRQVKWNQ